MKILTILKGLALTVLLYSPFAVQAQDTGALFNQMPPPYRGAVVKKGEIRTSEFFYTSAITANGNAALTTEKPSHPLRVVGVKLTCISKNYALCVFPGVNHNGKPLVDAVTVLGGRTMTIPLNEVLPLDTSDNISLASNCSISGLISTGDDAVTSRCQVELYTLRNFQPLAGAE